MATTKIRTSTQVYVDASLDVISNKIINLTPGTATGNAVEFDQMNTAISSALSGGGSSLHVPVADLAGAKAVASAGRSDKMLMNIETLGLYRYDLESTVTSNDGTVIRPTDIASDVTAGRWIQMASLTSDHNLTANKQGGTTAEYYHLTSAELTKLQGVSASADVTGITNVGTAIYTATAKITPVDADSIPLTNSASSNAMNKVTWANIKATLKTYFDTLYNLYVHPNHTGDVTSVNDGATTIATNVVTNAKLSQMATLTIKGNNTGATANSLDLTVAQVKTMLGISTRIYRATPTGTVNGSNTAFTIPALIVSGTESVYKNGILQQAGAGNDYTIAYSSTSTITFLTAPTSTPFVDIILVDYSV